MTAEQPGAQQWIPAGGDLDDLRAALPACRGCELWEPAGQAVFSAGSPNARVALVGEQPGDTEDRRGLPFVGPAGRLLQRAVADSGLPTDSVYVTNAVKHFRFRQDAPGKRRIHVTPDLAHLVACRPWLAAELALVDPQIVVCLGATAVRALLGAEVRVMRQRGEVIERDTSRGRKPFLVTVHPSSVLRAPDGAARDQAYEALVSDLSVATSRLS